jgi:WD40 repeat protein
LAGHTDHILTVSFHPAGKMVGTASVDGTVRLWDITPLTRFPSTAGGEGKAVKSKELRTFDFRSAGGALCAAFTPEGRYLAAGLGNGTIAVVRVGGFLPE